MYFYLPQTGSSLLSTVDPFTPARTYKQQLCADTGYILEDLPGAMDDRDGWRERVREICAGSAMMMMMVNENSSWLIFIIVMILFLLQSYYDGEFNYT